MYCREHSIVNEQSDRRQAISLTCRSWLCHDCKIVRRAKLIAQACAGRPDKMLTLTSRRREGRTPSEAARITAACWQLLRRRIARKYPYAKISYLAVFERHKSGWPHLHILMRGPWLSQQWISEQMAELDDSPNVDIRKIDNPGRAAGYVAKYIGKDPIKFGDCKRYWQSTDYQVEKREDPTGKNWSTEGWKKWSWSLRVIAAHWSTHWVVTYDGPHRLTAEPRAPP